MSTKAVVVVIDTEDEKLPQAVARLVAACLTLNGFDAGTPAVIDWPVTNADARA